MINKSVFEDVLISNMQTELHKQANQEDTTYLPMAADYLNSAAEILEETGFSKQANNIVEILSKIATKHKKKHKDDHSTKGLTSEKMTKNLEEHGTPFNAADDYQSWIDNNDARKTKIPLNKLDENLSGDLELDELQIDDLLDFDISSDDDMMIDEDLKLQFDDFEEERD